MRYIKFSAKILTASDAESDCTICRTLVLLSHLYR